MRVAFSTIPIPATKSRISARHRWDSPSDSAMASSPVSAFWIRYSRSMLPMLMPMSRMSAISRRASYRLSSAMTDTTKRFMTRITAHSRYTILRLRSTLSSTSRSTVFGLMTRYSDRPEYAFVSWE